MNFIFKLFGWLFSNLILIIVVLAACYAFVYWDDPFGDETPVGKVMAAFPDQTNAVKSFIGKLAIQDDDELFAETDSSTTVVVESSSVSEPAADSAAEVIETGQPAASITSDSYVDASSGLAVQPAREMQIAPDPAGSNFVTPEIEHALNRIKDDGSVAEPAEQPAQAAAEPQTAAEPPQVASAAPQFAPSNPVPTPPPVRPAAAPQPAEAPSASASDQAGTAAVAQASAPQSSTAADSKALAREMMIDARRAFMQRDYQASIAAYEKLIGVQKDNFDALGELGNVYYNQGDMQKAADAYYQAATIMIAQGKGRRASSLVGFLRSVDEDKAKKLEQSLDQSQNMPESL